jgi:hypothetical protein
MNSITTSMLLFVAAADEKKDVPLAPPLPIGKETTYVTGPIDKDGFIDFETALNERLGKGIKAETNCNALLFKAFGPRPEGADMPKGYFKWLGIPEPPEKGDYLFSLGAYMARLNLVPMQRQELIEQHDRAMGRPWKAEDIPHITAWLDLNEKPLAVVLEATRRPHYFNPLLAIKPDKGRALLIGCLLSSVQKCREIATLLKARAMQRVGAGKYDEAWQDLLACHRLGRHIANGATLIESLVGIAIEHIASHATITFLATANLSVKQIRACLKDLQDLPAMPGMADKIDLCERFTYVDCVQNIRTGSVKLLQGLAREDLPFPEDEKKAAKILTQIDWTQALRNGNRWYDRMSDSMRRKERGERELELDRLESDLKDLKKNALKLIEKLDKQPANEAVGKAIGDMLITMLMPAVRKVQFASDRCEQNQRNLHVAFALAAYEKEKGKYPAKLDDLAPQYLAAVPGDIFSGKALIYRPAEKGYLLYSVGMNGKDDEGRAYGDEPAGDDLGVRIPLPELKIRR